MAFTRRGFLFLCAATPPALWLAGHDVASLTGRMVIDLAGTCSFCGESRAQVRALSGVFGRPQRICDECVGLCVDVIREDFLPARAQDSTQRAHGRRLILDGEPYVEDETHVMDRLLSDLRT